MMRQYIEDMEIPIAIKSAMTDNSESSGNNANPRIRHRDYVSMLSNLLVPFEQSLRVRIRRIRNKMQRLLFLLFKAVRPFF
jgi:hypothetical protein